jgi:hypothetical protein
MLSRRRCILSIRRGLVVLGLCDRTRERVVDAIRFTTVYTEDISFGWIGCVVGSVLVDWGTVGGDVSR